MDWFLAQPSTLWEVTHPGTLTEEMFVAASKAVLRNHGGIETLIVAPLQFWCLSWIGALRQRCHNYFISRVHGRLVTCPKCDAKVRTVRGHLPSHYAHETPAQRLERYQTLRALYDEGREQGYWKAGYEAELRRQVDFGRAEGRAVFGDLARSG